MNAAPSIRIDNLWFQLGGRTLFKALSADMHPGVHWIRGPNGVGKTTLLKLLVGAIQPSSGSILHCNSSITDLSLAQRQQLFFCGDDIPDLAWLSAGELLSVYQSIYPALQFGRLQHFMALFRLDAVARTPARSLSLGERKKLLLAIAFSLDFSVLLLDEPFNALDACARDMVQQLLLDRSAAKHQIIAVTSHLEPQAVDQVIDLERSDSL